MSWWWRRRRLRRFQHHRRRRHKNKQKPRAFLKEKKNIEKGSCSCYLVLLLLPSPVSVPFESCLLAWNRQKVHFLFLLPARRRRRGLVKSWNILYLRRGRFLFVGEYSRIFHSGVLLTAPPSRPLVQGIVSPFPLLSPILVVLEIFLGVQIYDFVLLPFWLRSSRAIRLRDGLCFLGNNRPVQNTSTSKNTVELP